MSTTVRVGNRQLTAELICQHVSRSSLLPQLLREIILDRILAQWEPASTAELADGRAAFEQCYQQLAGLTHSRQMSQIQLAKIAERTVKLQQFKQGIWGRKLGSYFLERKSQLDRVVFSMMQIEDGSIAQELYFQIQAGENPFAELAQQYSQGIEAHAGGKVGPISIGNLHPDMARQIGLLQPGQVSPLFIINNAFVFVQLTEMIPARFDDRLRQSLLDELFEKWLQAQISNEIGLISLETDFIPPDFMTNSQRVIVEEQTTNGLKLMFPSNPNANETPVDLQPSVGLESSNRSPLGSSSHSSVGELERAAALEIESNSPAEFVLERGDTGLLLAQLGDIASSPAARVDEPKQQPLSSFNTNSGFLFPTKAEPVTYISDLDREFNAHKWLAILAIAVTTLALSLGSFYQLRSTGLTNTPIPPQQPK